MELRSLPPETRFRIPGTPWLTGRVVMHHIGGSSVDLFRVLSDAGPPRERVVISSTTEVEPLCVDSQD